MTELDHITVAAASLEQGVAYVRDALGVELPFGGKHPRMATHNCLMRLGDAAFLEIIAIDPDAPAPPRPRWFQLDDPDIAAGLPRLLTWVVRTDHIAEVFLASLASGQPLGAIEPMQRGDLRWLLTFPNDGALVDHGLIPSIIQWPAGAHPASRMADLGCRLERLEAHHPAPARYRADLAAIGADRQVDIASAPAPHQLIAHVRTPSGPRVLR